MQSLNYIGRDIPLQSCHTKNIATPTYRPYQHDITISIIFMDLLRIHSVTHRYILPRQFCSEYFTPSAIVPLPLAYYSESMEPDRSSTTVISLKSFFI